MIRIITYFLVSIIEIYAIHILFSSLSKTRLPKKHTFLILSAAVLLDTALSMLFAGNGTMLLMWIVLCCCIIGIIYKTRPLFAIIGSIVYCVVNAASEMLVVMGLTYVLGDESLAFLQDDYIYFGAALLCKFVLFIVIFFCARKIGKVDLGLTRGLSFLFALQPATTVLVTVIVCECTYKASSLPSVLFSLTALSMILANMVTVVLIYRQKEYIETKTQLLFTDEQLKNQTAHYEELYRYQNELRMFRHDIKNKLSAIAGLLQNEKTREALEAIEKENEFLTRSAAAVINTGNPALDASLQSKLLLAKRENIFLDVKLNIAQEIKIPPAELGVIVGNLLDNAIEGVQKTSDKDKKIIVEIVAIAGRVSFHTENKISENTGKKTFTTSKEDTVNHGFGLKSIKAIAEKYDGEIFISTDNGIFSISVNISDTFAE